MQHDRSSQSLNTGLNTDLNVGVGVRKKHFFEWKLRLEDPSSDLPTLVEFIAENVIGRDSKEARLLDMFLERGVRVLVHGVSMSIGGHQPFDAGWCESLKGLLRKTNAAFYSDHLAFTEEHGCQLFDLLPVPFNQGEALRVAGRVRELTQRLEHQVVLENISFYDELGDKDSRISEANFVNEVLERSDARLLLDINNWVVNQKNNMITSGLDAYALERIAYVHVAGHRHDKHWGFFVDDHASIVPPEVVDAFRAAALGACDIVYEWDQSLESLGALLNERARLEQTLVGVDP